MCIKVWVAVRVSSSPVYIERKNAGKNMGYRKKTATETWGVPPTKKTKTQTILDKIYLN